MMQVWMGASGRVRLWLFRLELRNIPIQPHLGIPLPAGGLLKLRSAGPKIWLQRFRPLRFRH